MPMTLTDNEIETVKNIFDQESAQRYTGPHATSHLNSVRSEFVALVNNQVQRSRRKDPDYTVTDAMLELNKTHGTPCPTR